MATSADAGLTPAATAAQGTDLGCYISALTASQMYKANSRKGKVLSLYIALVRSWLGLDDVTFEERIQGNNK